ncbi:MAG: TonB-dependent receptor, partial [Bacteroidota bacterium]
IEEENILKIDAEGIQHAIFGSYESLLFDRLHYRLGLRATHYNLNEKLHLSPRIDLNYKVSEQFYLKGALSKYYQFTQQINYQDRLGRSLDFWLVNIDRQFPITNSNHQMLGFRCLNNLFDLDVEAYRKNTFGLLQFSARKVGFDDEGRPDSNTDLITYVGNNINQGIDITIKKNIDWYTGWIAYTLSESKNIIDDINNGEVFPSPNDQRHQLKFVNQLNFKNFEAGLSYIFSSGKPFIDVRKQRGGLDEDDNIPELLTYIKSYQRVDLNAAFKLDVGTSTFRVGASVFNLLDRENIKYKQFIYNVSKDFQQSAENDTFYGNDLRLLGRTFNVFARVGF